MTVLLQVMLIIFSFLNLFYTIFQIRKSHLTIDDAIFSICFSFILIFMSLFPQVIMDLSAAFGFYSASNFVLVFIVFLLIIQTLKLQTRLSNVNEKLKTLNQAIALKENKQRTRE